MSLTCRLTAAEATQGKEQGKELAPLTILLEEHLLLLFPRLCHTVKSSHSQLVATPLYTTVNSSHDFRRFEGVTIGQCDELTDSHFPAVNLAWSNTKPPHFHNFVAYSTQICTTPQSPHLWKDRQHFRVESCKNCVHNIGKPVVNPIFVKMVLTGLM